MRDLRLPDDHGVLQRRPPFGWASLLHPLRLMNPLDVQSRTTCECGAVAKLKLSWAHKDPEYACPRCAEEIKRYSVVSAPAITKLGRVVR